MTTGSINTSSLRLPEGIRLTHPLTEENAKILTPECLRFVAMFEREFGSRRRNLLRKRLERQQELITGRRPGFLPSTAHIRQGYWRIPNPPADLQNRKVELVGPPDLESVLDGLHSRANVYVADFEDSFSPLWNNIIAGQANLAGAIDGTITSASDDPPSSGKGHGTTFMVRPRGWHLDEKHLLIDGRRISASLFDFGVYFFHNVRKLLEQDSGAYFYLPKIENHHEAMLWNEVFLMAEDEFGVSRGTIRATVLIEDVLAAFEMHEILFALKDHSAGLGCNQWGYVSSFIRRFRHHPEYAMPDRARLTMMMHFLRCVSLLLIQTSHKRGAHAIGSMTCFVPDEADQYTKDEVMTKEKTDKERQVEDGHDGTWVAHPAYVPMARSIFGGLIRGPNQVHRKREDIEIAGVDLLTIPKGEMTENGFRFNVEVALRYLERWLRGFGTTTIDGIREDAASADFCRRQLWQSVHHPTLRLANGLRAKRDYFQKMILEEIRRSAARRNPDKAGSETFSKAATVLSTLVLDTSFKDFMTQTAYEQLD